MTEEEAMRQIDTLLSHVWMVRAFIKHSDEAAGDDELAGVHRTLYDFMLALGEPWKEQNADAYLKQARKKFSKLRGAAELFTQIQPEVSSHTNFQMTVCSLNEAVQRIDDVLNELHT